MQCRGLHGCPQLEELSLWFGFASKDGVYYDLEGLPASVRTVSIRAPSARVKVCSGNPWTSCSGPGPIQPDRRLVSCGQVRAAPTGGCAVSAPSVGLHFECLTLQFLGPSARFPPECRVSIRAGVLENDGLGAPLVLCLPANHHSLDLARHAVEKSMSQLPLGGRALRCRFRSRNHSENDTCSLQLWCSWASVTF